MPMVHWWYFPNYLCRHRQLNKASIKYPLSSWTQQPAIWPADILQSFENESWWRIHVFGREDSVCVIAMILTTSIAGRLRAWWPQKVDWTCGSGSQNWYCWAGYNVYLHTWWQEWVKWNIVGIGTLEQGIFIRSNVARWSCSMPVCIMSQTQFKTVVMTFKCTQCT